MISGQSVIVRTIRETDLPTLFVLMADLNDPGEFMPVAFFSERAMIADFEKNGCWENTTGKLIITDLSGEIVGEAGFSQNRHYLDGREVYYRIFSAHRGKGYASEALRLLTAYFFKATSMSRLEAVTVTGNIASEKVLDKNGFVLEGMLRKARYLHGELVDLTLFSLLRSDL